MRSPDKSHLSLHICAGAPELLHFEHIMITIVCAVLPESGLLAYNDTGRMVIRPNKIVLYFVSTRKPLILLHANNNDADQPMHPRSLISALVGCNYL